MLYNMESIKFGILFFLWAQNCDSKGTRWHLLNPYAVVHAVGPKRRNTLRVKPAAGHVPNASTIRYCILLLCKSAVYTVLVRSAISSSSAWPTALAPTRLIFFHSRAVPCRWLLRGSSLSCLTRQDLHTMPGHFPALSPQLFSLCLSFFVSFINNATGFRPCTQCSRQHVG